MPNHKTNIDTSLLRKTLGCFPTGVVVAATLDVNGKPAGLTINSFSSVSLDPPLILISIALKAPSLSAFRQHDAFTINVLSEEQKTVCKQFATPSDDKFRGIDWHPGVVGAPVVAGALAVIQCRAYRRYEGGDHEIMLGEVVQLGFTDKQPLVYHRGDFAELARTCA